MSAEQYHQYCRRKIKFFSGKTNLSAEHKELSLEWINLGVVNGKLSVEQEELSGDQIKLSIGQIYLTSDIWTACRT